MNEPTDKQTNKQTNKQTQRIAISPYGGTNKSKCRSISRVFLTPRSAGCRPVKTMSRQGGLSVVTDQLVTSRSLMT